MSVIDSISEEHAETRRRLLRAVDDVRPVLMAGADAAEADGTLPEAGWRALHDSGLFRLKAPRVLGGAEADPRTHLEVIEAVSAIDTSAGWTLMIGAGVVSRYAAWLSDAGVDAFLVDGRLPRMASGIIPSGSAVTVDGGYRLTARWQFGSGAEHAEWFGGTSVVTDRDPPKILGFVFPRSVVTLHANWQVGALKGTGSQDFSVADVFVPEHLTIDGAGPARRGGPLYNIGLPGYYANDHAGFVLGAARRSIDEMTALAKSKSRGYLRPQGVAGRSAFQLDLGRADVQLRCARAGVLDAYQRAWDLVRTGLPCGVGMQTELRSMAVHAHDVAIGVCERMFRHAGARSLFTGNVLERNLRDVLAAAQHGMVNESAYELHGQALLGVDDVTALT
jgi:indole-3-acetate monooxygenase